MDCRLNTFMSDPGRVRVFITRLSPRILPVCEWIVIGRLSLTDEAKTEVGRRVEFSLSLHWCSRRGYG